MKKDPDYVQQRRKLLVVSALYLAASGALWFWLGAYALILLLPAALLTVLAVQLTTWRRLHRHARRLHNDALRQTQALNAIHTLLPLRMPLPAMGQYTIDPDFAALLITTIFEHRPRHVLELGSGVSTLVVAYALSVNGGGQVISVDEHEHYAALTQHDLKRHGLDDFARVVHTPLVQMRLNDEPYRWYDPAPLDDLPAIDLLIVDGPSGRTGPLARYPALPLLYAKLSERAIVILDDADRPDEKQIVAKWREQFDTLRNEHVSTRKGACVLSRTSA